MSEHTEAIKNHFKKHKTKYAFIGGIALASGTCLIVGRYAPSFDVGNGPSIDSSVAVRPISFLMRDVVTTVHTGTHGHPGFRTRNVETGAEYDTQAEAARAFDIPASILSQHLNTGRELEENLHFERIAA